MDDFSEFLSRFLGARRGESGSVVLTFRIEGNRMLLRIPDEYAQALAEVAAVICGGAARSAPKKEGEAA